MASAVKDSRSGYGPLLRTPGAWTFLLPGFLARQPFAMLTIGIVLLVESTTGSYGIAGAVSAATGVSMALFAPQSGKLADRFGQRAVLIPGVLVHVAGVAALTALALAHAPCGRCSRWPSPRAPRRRRSARWCGPAGPPGSAAAR